MPGTSGPRERTSSPTSSTAVVIWRRPGGRCTASAAWHRTDQGRRKRPPVSPELAPDPIVVYGSPRSGTSYLQQILNSHPEVCITHETRVFEWLYQAVALADDDRFVYNHRREFAAHLRTFL